MRNRCLEFGHWQELAACVGSHVALAPLCLRTEERWEGLGEGREVICPLVGNGRRDISEVPRFFEQQSISPVAVEATGGEWLRLPLGGAANASHTPEGTAARRLLFHLLTFDGLTTAVLLVLWIRRASGRDFKALRYNSSLCQNLLAS